jgi:hypothetical protein
MSMNRILFCKRYCSLLALCLVMGCTDWLPSEIKLTQNQLQSWVQRRFPLEKKQSLVIAEVFARLDNPVLSLDAEHQRVRLAARVQIVVDNGINRSGSIAMSGGLAFDPNRHALVLRNPKLEELHVDGMPPGILPMLGGVWLHDLGDISIYTLPAEQIKKYGKAFDNATITIFPESVLISR